MPERVFLGWNEPFLHPLVAWLLARKAELPGMLIVMPTTQSGRRLRETLAETAGAILSPRVVTPSSLLYPEEAGIAPDWIEQLAWSEVLESIDDWSGYSALFPEKPGEGSGWGLPLAAEMAGLRRSLQENGLTLQTAFWPLKETIEGDRWKALASLERLVEAKLAAWKWKSRSRSLGEGIRLPGVSHMVLAGVAEIPPLLRRTLLEWPGKVTFLIGAPEDLADRFCAAGMPTEDWAEDTIPWPQHGSVKIVADPRQQAATALEAVARAGRDSAQIALGSADAETGEELQRAFTRGGWIAFHPAALAITSGLPRWFTVWREWLVNPQLSTLADLLALPETGILVGGRRAQKATQLAKLRDRWMALRTDDLDRRFEAETFRDERDREESLKLIEAARKLENLRHALLGRDFPHALRRLLETLSHTGPATGEMAVEMLGWLDQAAPLMMTTPRSPGDWIGLMISQFPSPAPIPPAGRVIDVQGWLELFHEPGEHLVICGMNEGSVPARGGGEPWLSETIRGILGLIRDVDRAARDAFLLRAMTEARRATGRVDLLCGKGGSGGETLLPSRLLLAGETAELPERVLTLFRDVEPPEAGMRWQADWQWTPRILPPPEKVDVTALRDYLKCPFRYYLKHVVRMRSLSPDRNEWDARDFGNVAHWILEQWGLDEDARDYSKSEALEAYFHDRLDRMIGLQFGKAVPLAIRIQREVMRQRLSWLAVKQACERAAGWHVLKVETPVELTFRGLTVKAKIDRIDRHDDGRVRVLDYKTGKVAGVEKEHRSKIGPATLIPEHVKDGPAIFHGMDRGRPAAFLWDNLQLPLYVSAIRKTLGAFAIPAYVTLGTTEAEVAFHEWPDFSEGDLAAAEACADWIAGKIAEGIFWPPAERVKYDDYRVLAAGRNLAEMIAPPA